MKSLLIGKGQEFSLVRRAFQKVGHKVEIIGQDIPSHLAYQNRKRQQLAFKDLKDYRFTKSDLKDIDSIFLSIYERADLAGILKNLSRIDPGQPVFVISTAIDEKLKSRFSSFHFVEIHNLFSAQVKSILAKCDYLFRVNRLRSLVKPKESILIVIFENPDPDSIASAIALKALLSKIKVKSTIAYTGDINRLQNEVLIKESGVPFLKIGKARLDEFDRIATVDAQPYFFQEKFKFDIVIDHHPRRVKYHAPFVDVRPKMGATSTIMTQYLLSAGVKITPKIATCLLFGIKTDTNRFELHVQDEDIRTFRYLFSRADHALLKRIELSEIPQAALPYFRYSLTNMKIVNDQIYVNLGKVKLPEVHVMVADFLLRLGQISSVIVSAMHDRNLIVIFRDEGRRDVGRLASLAFGKIGNAGGHKSMARAEIPCQALTKICRPFRKKSIDKFVLGRINKYLKRV